MDPDIGIIYTAGEGKLITETQIEACLASQFNRKTLPAEQENEIIVIWKKRLLQNNRLFNGTKFRFDSLTVGSNGLPQLNLGVTCYRDFLGTNWSPRATELRHMGEECNNSQIYMSDPLGVGACVIASDNHLVFLQRGSYQAEAAGLWDVPGGHPEPKELAGNIPVEEMIPEKFNNRDVVHEIYDSIIREIVDEVNIPSGSLSWPCLMGIARNHLSSGRASAEFLVRCSLSSTEIKQLYMAGGHSEAEESTCIKFVSDNDVLSMEREPESIWHQMAPSGKGCVKLYCLYREKTVE